MTLFFYINTVEYLKPRFELARKEINIIMDYNAHSQLKSLCERRGFKVKHP